MSDRLIRLDRERGKAVFMRTITNDDGTTCEKEIEMDLPPMEMVEGTVRTYQRGDDGKMYETEKTIRFPMMKQTDKKEEK